MSITHDKLLLFNSHDCAKGLSDEALREICDAAELVQLDSGDYLHRATQTLSSVYLIVHGRFKQSVVDMHGHVLLQRFLTRGSQFGVLGASQAEPLPVDVMAVEPSAVLRLDFDTALGFTRKHEAFGLNLTHLVSSMVRQVLLSPGQRKKPALVTVFHESPTSRPLTRRMIRRLLDLGETPCLMSDGADWEPIENVPSRALVENGHLLSREEFRRQINLWSDSGRVILDVDAALDPVHAALCVEFSDQVFWCTNSEKVESSVYRLKAIETRAPGWRDKINLVWMLEDDSWVAPPAVELRSVNMNSVGVQPADVVIEPDVTTVDLSAFSQTRELATIGEETALEVTPKIKSLLAQVDGQLFPDH